MHLFLVLLERTDQPEKIIQRLRSFEVPDPLVLRARSTAALLAAEVPVFAGLRSLAFGADEDRLILLWVKAFATAEEAERLVTRLQLEFDADTPPSGRVFALPVFGAG